MKTFLAQVIGIKVIAYLESGREVELSTYSADTRNDNIKFNYDEVEKEHGKVLCIRTQRVYNTKSGKLEPGCLFWVDWYPKNLYWDNQDGPYLFAMLPNHNHWNIDGRASNCDMPDERLHRCWCRHGEVPEITVDKVGHTCNAGAGSIQSGDYHGFLINGEFT
jgi:hypothetical protein